MPADKSRKGRKVKAVEGDQTTPATSPAPPVPAEVLSIEERVRRRQRGEPGPQPPAAGPDPESAPAEPTPSAEISRARPSLGELQARTSGWDCPRCGCRDWRVINSYVCADGTRHRRQFCRHCYYVRMTVEAVQE